MQPSPAALPPRAPVPLAQPHDVSPATPAPTPAPMVPQSTPTAEPSAMSSAPQHPLPAVARPTQPQPTPAAPAPEPEVSTQLTPANKPYSHGVIIYAYVSNSIGMVLVCPSWKLHCKGHACQKTHRIGAVLIFMLSNPCTGSLTCLTQLRCMRGPDLRILRAFSSLDLFLSWHHCKTRVPTLMFVQAMPTPQQQEPPKQAIPPEAEPEPEPEPQQPQQQQQDTWTPSAELEPEVHVAFPAGASLRQFQTTFHADHPMRMQDAAWWMLLSVIPIKLHLRVAPEDLL